MEEVFKQSIKNFNDFGNEIGTTHNRYTLKELINKIIPQELIDKDRQDKKELYIFEDIKTPLLQEEQWGLHPEGKYHVSTLARVKYKDEILPQKNKLNDKGKEMRGYLVLAQNESSNGIKLNTTKHIYEFAAETFLRERPCDGAVHHITNNGYDNRPENLIRLKWCVHACIHPFMVDFRIPYVCQKCSVCKELKDILKEYKNKKNINTINDLHDWSIFLIDENNFSAGVICT
ncbi:MAG: hypothetical protein WCG23_06760 [bacterium]